MISDKSVSLPSPRGSCAPCNPDKGFDYYYEADVLGNPQLPESIRFVLALFPELFGTAEGVKVQQWCKSQGWTLIWSLGPNFGTDTVNRPDSYAANNRMLDPGTLESVPNVTASSGALAKFANIWTTIATARKAPARPSNTTFARWWGDLEAMTGDELRVQPLTATSCAKPDDCVGVSSKHGCICYR